jgi:tetratricopeptide (TPR) repeat protein
VVVSRTIQIAAGLVFFAAGMMTFRSLAVRGASRRSLLPAITLYITQALWFVIPIVLAWVSSAATPQTRYSTGILAVMHSAQYLWITHHFARKDAAGAAGATGAAGPGQARAWNGWAYWTTLVAGGVALFIPGPWLASYAGRFDFTSSMLIVTAVVNIHHFILDGVVWKLRDPRVSNVLTSNQASHEEGPASTAGAVARATGARMKLVLRAAAVVGLIALAGVDQWRYLLALGGAQGADRGALERASALNPFDSSVQLRLASAARLSGDRAAMERDLRRAVAVDSYSPAPYHALERFLIESERWQDAYVHCQLLLERWPREVDTLVNAGVLAQKLNDSASAERWWRRALDVDDSLRDVHLYLAELLDGRTRFAESVPHYQRYLELVVHAANGDPSAAARVSPERTALVVIKFGDALARTNQPELAASQYDLAASIAQRTGLAEIEATARERRTSARLSP